VTKYFKQNILKVVSILGLVLLFGGCAKDKLLLTAYTSPTQMDKVKELMAKTTSNDKYLDLYINESKEDIKAILNGKHISRDVAETLLGNVKAYLSETNFIGINQNGDSNTISLEMKIVSYSYDTSIKNMIKADLEVSFAFIKDENAKPLYIVQYKSSAKRTSRSGPQGLPSKASILSKLTKDIAEDLVLDISPTKSRKLVYLKSLPDEIKYSIQYAKQENFKGAIKVMLKYKGEKTIEYYFNLAVYYEGLASKINDFKLLFKANENYEQAMSMGGHKDEDIVKTKAKFDNFYDLIKLINKQKKSNSKANKNNGFEIL